MNEIQNIINEIDNQITAQSLRNHINEAKHQSNMLIMMNKSELSVDDLQRMDNIVEELSRCFTIIQKRILDNTEHSRRLIGRFDK